MDGNGVVCDLYTNCATCHRSAGGGNAKAGPSAGSRRNQAASNATGRWGREQC
ncbi:c-type cytochrome [Brevibacillus invocatus]|uniref:c-type cytochrome n=1 Tax=Brevibacillus invocatus TaxID=173959 RepID=UPI0039EF2594